MNLMLLAAGLGTRLRPYTLQLPKPAIPFFSVPLICYPLSLFEDQRIDNLVINTHHLPEKMSELFASLHWPLKKEPKRLMFSHEPEKILGSGGGIRQALHLLRGQGNFVVANADEVILPAHYDLIKDAMAFHKFHGGIATLICMRHPEVGHKFGGVWTLQENPTQVKTFSKTPIAGLQGLHFIGILILRDQIENYFSTDSNSEENILYETLHKAMAAGEQVHAFEANDIRWFEIGNPSDFLAATNECLKAIDHEVASDWARFLQQLINRCGKNQFVVEEQDPDLVLKMKTVIQKINSGEF